MIARWDVLLLAAAVLGGSMMIESSHRLDTGASDEALVATPAATACLDPQAYARASLKRDFGNEEGFSTAGADDNPALGVVPCASE